MIPRGPIFAKLRSLGLSFYPTETRTVWGRSSPFHGWLGTGAYVVTGAAGGTISFRACPQDIGEALLTDVEYLTDSCYEHLLEATCFSSDARRRSDAWNVVCMYYFGLFSAQALLRLVGNPVVFLNRDRIASLRHLTGTDHGVSPGAYLLEKMADVSVTQAEYRLKRLKTRLHDATWRRILELLRALLQQCAQPKSDDERIFYGMLTTDSLQKVYREWAWPCLVREKANYEIGFAYRLVESENVAKTKALMKSWKCSSPLEVISSLSSSVDACRLARRPTFPDHVRLMHSTSICLFLLCRELYSEILKRTSMDRRWEQARRRFALASFMDGDGLDRLVAIS